MNARLFWWSLLFFLSVPSLSLAAEGVMLEPAIQKIYLTETGNTKEPLETVTLKNATNQELLFNIRAIEFSDIDKSGGNIFLGQSLVGGEFQEASWIELPETRILLIPGEQKEITFRIKNAGELLPGAHYAALLFETMRPENAEDPELSKVFLRQIATSLLYVSKESGQEQKLSVHTIKRYQSFPGLVDSLAITFVNEGDNFVEPRGLVVVRNIFGQAIGKSIINESSKLVFPAQTREIEVRFKNLRAFLPGPYTFEVHYRIGEEEYQTKTLRVWYWEPFIFLASLLIIAVLVVFAWRKRRPQKNSQKEG